MHRIELFRIERRKEQPAALDGVTDVLDQLNNGSLLQLPGFDDGVHLCGEHRLLLADAVGEHHPEPLRRGLRSTHRPDLRHLEDRLQAVRRRPSVCDRRYRPSREANLRHPSSSASS